MTTSKHSKSDTKIVPVPVSLELHTKIKKLAKFQGITMQAAGIQAFEDWTAWIIENEVKPVITELRDKTKIAREIINIK